MLKIRPVIVIGIGPQAEQTVKSYVERVRIRQGHIPAILPVILGYSADPLPFRRGSDGVQYLTLSSPVFDADDVWPPWLPAEIADVPPVERARIRAWLRAALLQQADELQELLLESIPSLTSFSAVEEMSKADVSLVGDSEVRIYVVADLGDHLGSSVFVDMAYLTYYVCRQLGLRPSTTGLLFLPSATSPAPAEEAIAYASLKELEHYLETRIYNGTFAPDWAPGEQLSPFEDGCYLLDNVNELGYTLQDSAQQTLAVSEWLYAMSLLDMQGAVREHRQRRYLTATLRNKSRAYESFGMAINYVPQIPLRDWATARLCSTALEHILTAPVNGDPERDATAFIVRNGLDIDALGEDLLRQAEERPIQEALAPIASAPMSQVEARARQVLQTIRERYLPVLDQSLNEASKAVQYETQDAVTQEILAILRDTTLGGIPSARRFLQQLRDHVTSLQQEAEELSRRHRIDLKQSLATISRTHYTLRSVVMSVPPWPVSALSAIAWLVLPLIYCILLVQQVIRPLNPAWSSAALIALVVGVLGVIGFVIQRLLRQRKLVTEQHESMIRERFALESRPLVSKAIRAVYNTLQEAIDEAEESLDPLVTELEAVSAHFDLMTRRTAHQLRELARPGPFRSVVGMEEAERFFAQVSPEAEQFTETAIAEIGSLAEWYTRTYSSEQPLQSWLSDQLVQVGTRHIERHMEQVDVLDLMTKTVHPGDVQHELARMFESARPLWNYEPRLLRRAKTQQLALVGVDTSGSGWAGIVEPLSRVNPDLISVGTSDRFTMVILQVHRGLPLFALRRIGEYRAHYAEMLWRSKLPVHTMRTFRLVEDLVPIRHRTRLSTATLFAVGLALGSIGRDADDRYLAPRPRGQTIRLSAQKERSVALMSMDAAACRELERQVSALVARKGKKALCTILDEYVTVVPGLEDWEVRAILGFARRFGLGDNNSAHTNQDVHLVRAE